MFSRNCYQNSKVARYGRLAILLTVFMAHLANAQTKTYTLVTDFNEETVPPITVFPINTEGVSGGGNGELAIKTVPQTLPFVWVACSTRGTIVRIEAETRLVVGEYLTSMDVPGFTTCGSSPSRTTVDFDGNVWAGNRVNVSTLGPSTGSVVKIGTGYGYQWKDYNCNGELDTSQGLGLIMDWTGQVSNHCGADVEPVDELILLYQPVSARGVRTIAVDRANNVWVGGRDNYEHGLLDGQTGNLADLDNDGIDDFPFEVKHCATETADWGGYGGIVDKNNVLWSASGERGPDTQLLRFDPAAESTDCIPVEDSYGLAVDMDGDIWNTMFMDDGQVAQITPTSPWNQAVYFTGPAGDRKWPRGIVVTPDDNHVWLVNSLVSDNVSRLAPDGVTLETLPLVFQGNQGIQPTGVAVDSAGLVWVTNLSSNDVMIIQPDYLGTCSDTNEQCVNGGCASPGICNYNSTIIDRIDLNDYIPEEGEAHVDCGPYNYSDMTGLNLMWTIAPAGTWSAVFEGDEVGTIWGNVTWDAVLGGAGNSMIVQVRAADKDTDLGKALYRDVEHDVPFSCTLCPTSDPDCDLIQGKFVQIRVQLNTASREATPWPVLKRLTIEGAPSFSDCDGNSERDECDGFTCDDGNDCTDDSCDPILGCLYTNNVAVCDDGNACTTNDACSAGICVGGAAPDCDDANLCTDDSCDTALGCQNVNNTLACDDGSACTIGDACSAGVCVSGSPPDCDDGEICTDDSCDAALGCQNVDNTVACDDGSACTTSDVCSAGVCVGGAAPDCDDGNLCTTDSCDIVDGCQSINNTVPCDDGSACTIGDVCSAGACVSGSPLDCDDGNICTDDSCDAALGCQYVNITGACDDENACTTVDTCSAGVCVGGPAPDCDDGDDCNGAEACHPVSGCEAGKPPGGEYLVPSEYSSIQAAIDAAGCGAQIIVDADIYYETINFVGKGITVRSSSGPDATIIDATGLNDSVVKCVNSEGPDTVLEGFTITGGNASYGGGMFNDNYSSPTVINCKFIGNSAVYGGGGMCNDWQNNTTVTDCTFSGNTAGGGGGMYNAASNATVTNCVFSGNSAVNYGNGGGMTNTSGSSTTVTNCLFSGNSAVQRGGAMNNWFDSSPKVTNCTFTGNSVDMSGFGFGGVIYNLHDSSPTVTNCILWDNSTWSIIDYYGSAPNVTYSLVEGGYTGIGNIDVDPLFVDAAGDDLRLACGSPCIDVGDNEAVPIGITTDLDGASRFFDDPITADNGNGTAPIVDMGAYEYKILLVNVPGSIATTIQEAIDVVADGGEIIVAPGTYNEIINFNGKAITLHSSGGAAMTTIDATGRPGSVVKCISGEGPDTVLEGFTITGGTGTSCFTTLLCGGGMYNLDTPLFGFSSSPTVINCTFRGNSADVGAGMYNGSSDMSVINSKFINNVAAYYGGGMYSFAGSPTVTNCTFSGNSATVDGGGGMYNYTFSSLTVTNCILWGNNPDQIINVGQNAIPIVSFSDVEGGLVPGTIDGGGNINVDPQFDDVARHLADGSPCIDAGDNAAVPIGITTDLDGNDRIVNEIVDMGALENQTVPVPPGGSGPPKPGRE